MEVILLVVLLYGAFRFGRWWAERSRARFLMKDIWEKRKSHRGKTGPFWPM